MQRDSAEINNTWILIILCMISAVFTYSCDTRTDRIFSNSLTVQMHIANVDSEYIELYNSGNTPIPFTFSLNGEQLYSDADQLLRKIDAEPDPERKGFPFKTWRYLVKTTAHTEPISTDPFFASPLAYLNSIGCGFCDQRAVTFAGIMNLKGFKSRVWPLGGHYVSEVFYKGAWKMYDTDLNVYYEKENGEVCSVADLTRHPQWITHPVKRVNQSTAVCYSQELANMYTSTADNNPYTLNACNDLNQRTTTLTLIPHSRCKLFYGQLVTLPSLTRGRVDSMQVLTMDIAPGFSGQLRFALPVYRIEGNASLADESGALFNLVSGAAVINQQVVHTCYTVNKNEGVVFSLLLNRKRFSLREGANTLVVTSPQSLKDIRVASRRKPFPNAPEL